MKVRLIQMIPGTLLLLGICAIFGVLLALIIKALRKYIHSEPVRTEKRKNA